LVNQTGENVIMRIEAFSAAFSDIRATIRNYHLVLTLGWQDIAHKYRRSRIGAFWITIGMAVTIGALGLVFGHLFRQTMADFIPFFTIGTILWGFFSMALNEGSNSFITDAGVILQVRMPLFVHIMRVFWRSMIILGHNILILPIIFILFKKQVSFLTLLAIPGFLVFILNIGWMMLILAVICARFRDLAPLVLNIIHILYFITPIMWNEKLLTARIGAALLNYNPCYHLIVIVRAPLLGEAPSQLNWIFSISMIFAGWALALWIFGYFRNRIAYWL
jgi:ABC-type polysaccharide/polyol phosphate export permease